QPARRPDRLRRHARTARRRRPARRIHAEDGAAGLEDVDAVCLVVDATERAGPDELVLAPLREYGGVTVCALNKVDLVHPRSALLPLLERWGAAHPFAELVPISAADGSNCDRLLDLLVK